MFILLLYDGREFIQQKADINILTLMISTIQTKQV